MKRFLSLIIVLILAFSMFAVTAIAFADEETTTPDTEVEEYVHPEVTFNAEAFKQYVWDRHPANIEMSKTFMLAEDWWNDAAIVNEIFEGINYNILPDEDLEGKEEEFTVTYNKGEHAAEDVTLPEDANYKETQHVKLADALDAETGYKFAGWKVISELGAQVMPNETLAAGAKFAMPASNVTVYAQWIAEDEEIVEAVANDKIYVLYCNPSSDPREDMEDWSRCLVTSTFSVTTSGSWGFRFAVVDGTKASKSGYTFDWDDVLATSFDNVLDILDNGGTPVKSDDLTLWSTAQDTLKPTAALSESMKTKQTNGLTVGVTYTISTSLDIDDSSSTTVTYVVYKQVGTNVDEADADGWVLIYDSKSRAVTEGYESYISTSGVITPAESDVSDTPVYKVVYTIVDAYGNYAVFSENKDTLGDETGYHPTLLLKVVPAEVDSTDKAVEVWKIILYIVAGLSAVGIVVLLCIKPKQAVVADGRYTVKGEDENAEETADVSNE